MAHRKVSGFHPTKNPVFDEEIMASNSTIHEELLEVIERNWPRQDRRSGTPHREPSAAPTPTDPRGRTNLYYAVAQFTFGCIKSPVMKHLALPLVLAALSATAAKPEKMTVVVHTTDRVVVKFICQAALDQPADTLGIVERQAGRFQWHVVGGTAPYTVLKDEVVAGQSRCITVMDAEGRTATACGTVDTQVVLVPVDCVRSIAVDSLPVATPVPAPARDPGKGTMKPAVKGSGSGTPAPRPTGTKRAVKPLRKGTPAPKPNPGGVHPVDKTFPSERNNINAGSGTPGGGMPVRPTDTPSPGIHLSPQSTPR